jgi:hypothetical protein
MQQRLAPMRILRISLVDGVVCEIGLDVGPVVVLEALLKGGSVGLLAIQNAHAMLLFTRPR